MPLKADELFIGQRHRTGKATENHQRVVKRSAGISQVQAPVEEHSGECLEDMMTDIEIVEEARKRLTHFTKGVVKYLLGLRMETEE